MKYATVRILNKTQFLLCYEFENDGARQQKILVGKDEKPPQSIKNKITGVRISSPLRFLTVSKTEPTFGCCNSQSGALANIHFG